MIYHVFFCKWPLDFQTHQCGYMQSISILCSKSWWETSEKHIFLVKTTETRIKFLHEATKHCQIMASGVTGIGFRTRFLGKRFGENCGFD